MALTKLTTDLIDSTIVTSVNGSTGAVTLETGTDWQATPKTANFTAVAGEGYFVDTTSTAITVTLPSSPSFGDEVNLVDYAGTADTNNIIITSSDNINGASNDVLINYERGGVSIVYVDATQGWIAYNAANETAEALVPEIPLLTVDYLVVAGGGAGGGTYLGPGGGAGGLRTSYTNSSSLNGHTETSLSLTTATNYTVTVGGGGAGTFHTGGGENAAGNNGTDSKFGIIGSEIISTAGGGSGAYNGGNNPGKSGGSGGGAAYSNGAVGAAVTSPVTQGYAGGANGGASTYHGGGGGGANGAGASTGVGGAGLAVNILSSTNATTSSVGEVSGANVYYAGGGGGAGVDFGAAGGIGGGGDGNTAQGAAGTPNTGGGGGGSERNNPSGQFFYGGDGGSGVVILRYPSAYSITVGSGITEASGSPFTESTKKVSVFTGGTGNISFS